LFNHNPATPVDTKFAQTKTKLDNAITALGGKQALNVSLPAGAPVPAHA
jgi:hypothetical protein